MDQSIFWASADHCDWGMVYVRKSPEIDTTGEGRCGVDERHRSRGIRLRGFHLPYWYRSRPGESDIGAGPMNPISDQKRKWARTMWTNWAMDQVVHMATNRWNEAKGSLWTTCPNRYLSRPISRYIGQRPSSGSYGPSAWRGPQGSNIRKGLPSAVQISELAQRIWYWMEFDDLQK